MRRRTALLVEVSTRYYLDGWTQDQIADLFRVSRPTVSHWLRDARDAGIVQFTIARPEGVFLELEAELESGFGLTEARVVPLVHGATAEWTRRAIGAAAAADLARSARPAQTIGVGGGALLAAMVAEMVPVSVRDVRVVQAVGWDPAAASPDGLTTLVEDLARWLAGTPLVLPTLSVVGSELARRGLQADRHIAETLRGLDRLDTAYVEIECERDDLRRRVAARSVGRIACRHFDRAGRMLGTPADGHVVGITVEQLRRVGHVVALASAPDRAPCVAAALRTGIVRTLITDERTARAVAALRGPAVDAGEPSVARGAWSHAPRAEHRVRHARAAPAVSGRGR